jgi:hypothetical protein
MRDLGEGVDRMILEMEKFGLESPIFEEYAFMMRTTLRNNLSFVCGIGHYQAISVSFAGHLWKYRYILVKGKIVMQHSCCAPCFFST